MKRFFYFFNLLFVIVLFSGSLSYAEESNAQWQDVERKLTVLETKVNRVKTAHAEIIQKQTEIKKELETLKIWIHRNRN